MEYDYGNAEVAVKAEHVMKMYKLFTNRRNKLLELLLHKSQISNMYALSNLSFTIKKGESVGLLGLNGSGKTTLANLVAGITQPTSGKLIVSGNASCVSVSVGLNGNLTGMENIELKGLLLGFTLSQINELKPKIAEFADIGRYIYQPVKYYSSGMMARLGFAISINVDPDILVIDEGLAVGDPSFTDKCMNAMNLYRERGKTIIFVSHATSMVESFCTKAMWLEYGKIKMFGEVKEVCARYMEFHAKFQQMDIFERAQYQKEAMKDLIQE